MTHIAASIGALDRQDVTYIYTPCISINDHYLIQGRHLKNNIAGDLVYFFPRYTNEIMLPNPKLSLYKSPSLTFALVEQEEARRSSISCRVTRSRTMNEAGNAHQTLPTPTPLVPQAYHAEWFLAM